MTWMVLDLETTTAPLHGRKGSPFHPANWVVMAGWATKQNPRPTGRRYTKDGQARLGQDFADMVSDPDLRWVVGQNIKFDLLHLMRLDSFRSAWMQYVADGGLIWDLQLAEYIMDGQDQSSHMLSMDELAVKYGEDLKVDEVKKLWEAGVDTPDIDPDLLELYLLGEDLPNGGRREGDIGVTRNIFLKQVARAKEQGQLKLIAMEMGALIASIEMEHNGLFVDTDRGTELTNELREELAQALEELEQYLPEDLPFVFNWGNRYHLSPIIFGGEVTYDRREYDLARGGTTWEPPLPGTRDAYSYAQKDELRYILEDGRTMECLRWEHCYNTDHDFANNKANSRVQYKSGKNAGEYKTRKVKVPDWTKPKSRMVKDVYKFPGFTKPRPEWASSTPGLYSVAADVVDTLTKNTDVPFLKTLGRVTALSKDLGTYFVSDCGTKGMLTLVGEDGVVHPSINHTSTVTGRLSSARPNLQNLPRGDKSKAKELFRSRFPDGDIGQCDFSSLEVYGQAWITGAQQLVQDLLAGLDLHCVRLAAKEHRPYEEVLKLAKGYQDDDGTWVDADPKWDTARTVAKIFSFQRAYGAGLPTIAESTGLPLEEVTALAEAEDKRYPEINQYFDNLEKEILRNAAPTNTFIAHPVNPAIRVQLRISGVSTPDGKLYTFRSHPSPDWQLKRGITSTFSPTERMNYPVQGVGAQVMKAAMWLTVREFYRTGNFSGMALLVNTVHDALYRDSHPQWSYQSSVTMHACMELASDFIQFWFNWQVPLPVPGDSVRGATMAQETPLRGDQWVADVQREKDAIRARYMPGFKPTYQNLED